MPSRDPLLARFRTLTAPAQPDLFEGALAIAELVDASEDLGEARRRVAVLAQRVCEAAGGAPSHGALRRVLFSEDGFRGDDQEYDAPENSSVARVLARRRGMPITLSIVAIEVGRLAGLRLAGVGLPGHFVVSGPDLPDGVFLDSFDGGALYGKEDLSRRLGAIFGSAVSLTEDLLRPDSSREILARVLLNLRRSYERRERWEDALRALDFAEALQPEAGQPRERALLLFKCGRTDEAVEVLESEAEAAEGDDAQTLQRLLAFFRGQGGASGADIPRRTFTLEQARALLPRVRELTGDAVERYGRLGGEENDEREAIVRTWAQEIQALGIEVKGIWLVDFDSGAGYYCWKYPETALDHFHGYEEGFAGRLPLN